MSGGEREVMSWDDLGVGARTLAEAVADDGYHPDMILGIARGGLLVAARSATRSASRTRSR